MAIFNKFARGDGDNKPKFTTTSVQQQRSYRAVEIIPHAGRHCAAVEELTGCRILTDEAPSLPLPNCDQAECKCRYAPYKDRRAGSRRDADVGIAGIASMLSIDSGRSESAGRRAEDRDKD